MKTGHNIYRHPLHLMPPCVPGLSKSFSSHPGEMGAALAAALAASLAAPLASSLAEAAAGVFTWGGSHKQLVVLLFYSAVCFSLLERTSS